ncbi:hypothetical protein DMH03_05715 [Amycolatopsis sp. WAC 01376]|uniref:hypothetical protein n=1 Tax=Amycolatopsis sp. WAC 01376 TaxID=2203195 RepID=UPI000F7A76C3|nr:hypothetical protein [Amycolatopsis sp. WAC 01376]RSM66599.1 hypothetical protein DMH03_05715 [Amycolatopsis sp. WAC 01376]
MLDTGDTASPRTPYLHMVRPSRPVWVDLSVVYPVAETASVVSDGLDLTAKVPGLLGMWRATTTGHWVGWVVFAMESDSRSQWVVSDALSPRETRAP